MKRLILIVVPCMALLAARRAEAGWEHDAACTLLKVNPVYWPIREAVVGLKDSGALTSEMDCLDLGDTVGDLMFPFPTGTYKDCICESLDWPTVSPPMCSDPHTACETGDPLGASATMMSCVASPSEDIAAEVCATDPTCCEYNWGPQCVSEAATAFWNALDAKVEAIANRMDLSCDQKDSYVASLQLEADSDVAQLPCLGGKTYPSNCGDREYFEFSFGGKCMGVQAGNMNNGTNIIPWTCNANASNGFTNATDQAWTYDLYDCYTYGAVTTTYCAIRNGKNFNKCLGVKAGSTNEGSNLVIWDCLAGHPDQYWALSQDSHGNNYLQNLASAISFHTPGFGWGIRENSSTFNLDNLSPFTEYSVSK